MFWPEPLGRYLDNLSCDMFVIAFGHWLHWIYIFENHIWPYSVIAYYISFIAHHYMFAYHRIPFNSCVWMHTSKFIISVHTTSWIKSRCKMGSSLFLWWGSHFVFQQRGTVVDTPCCTFITWLLVFLQNQEKWKHL